MTGRDKKVIAEAVDERLKITEMPQATKADEAYVHGMIDMMRYFGYELRYDTTGQPMLIRM